MPSSLATLVVDFTTALSRLLGGLLGLVGLSAALVAWEALRHARAANAQHTAGPARAGAAYWQAA
jgi:hypothetical protein